MKQGDFDTSNHREELRDVVGIVFPGMGGANICPGDDVSGMKVQATYKTSSSATLTPVSAASVAKGAWSVLDGQATNGMGWAKVLIICNKAHTVRGVGGLADFTDYTVGGSIGSDATGKTDNSAKGGEWYAFDVSGLSYFCPTVQNNDSTDAATVTCKVVFFD